MRAGLKGLLCIFSKEKIDDVAIWDEALTNAEITELYNNGKSLYAKENYGNYTPKDNLTAYIQWIVIMELVQHYQMMKE